MILLADRWHTFELNRGQIKKDDGVMIVQTSVRALPASDTVIGLSSGTRNVMRE
jgi:hypothetical protein